MSALVRPYPRETPATNQFLAKRWDKEKFNTHRQKVAAAKAVIDNTPPTVHMHLHIKLKKLRYEAERLALIERDNRILLEKMAHIMRTGGLVDHKNYEFQHKSLNKAKRQRELLRITHENLAILKRLTTKEPHYNHKRWLLEWQANQQYLMNIAKHPHPWRKEQSPYKSMVQRQSKANKQINEKVKSKLTPEETPEPEKTPGATPLPNSPDRFTPACDIQIHAESDQDSNEVDTPLPTVDIKEEPNDGSEKVPEPPEATEGASINVKDEEKITISKNDYNDAVNVDLPKVDTPTSSPEC